jgi:hypothetical protein
VSTSTAALAPGKVPTFDPSRDLRIGGGDTLAGRGPAPGVVLSRPEPGAVPAPGATGVLPAGGTRALGVEQAQTVLASRGVRVLRLDQSGDNGAWRLVGAVPNRQNPDVNRVYDVQAADPVEAARAVIDKLDRER